MIKHFNANTLGRDFVCGDIHGSWSRLETFLNEINFDFVKDRLFCCGDLIDRGPENEKCLELLNTSWFFMVKGNHELMMEEYFRSGYLGRFWAQNGGQWGVRYEHENSEIAISIKKIIHEKISQLPLIITVDKVDGGKFHLLHAELFSRGKKINDKVLADEDVISEFAHIQTSDGSMILWGRHMFMGLYMQQLTDHFITKFRRGIVNSGTIKNYFDGDCSIIYSGHTIVTNPVQVFNQINLDTNAYGSYTLPNTAEPKEWQGLTFTEPATGKYWLVNNKEMKETQLVVII